MEPVVILRGQSGDRKRTARVAREGGEIGIGLLIIGQQGRYVKLLALDPMGESRYTSPTKEVEKWDLPELLGLVDRLEDGQSAVRGRNGDRGVLGRSNGASSGIQPSREERVERLERGQVLSS